MGQDEDNDEILRGIDALPIAAKDRELLKALRRQFLAEMERNNLIENGDQPPTDS
jgi:hypothetical protein